jgi:NADH:ubiquinone oxidoreductase subunit 5 (subunit L)/multisubunit Na+/H+ antiporter MnhA subunit
MAWRAQGAAASRPRISGNGCRPGKPLATIGVIADGDSTVMLMLVTLVALLVQLYSLEYLHDEPPQGLGRYYTISRSSRSR